MTSSNMITAMYKVNNPPSAIRKLDMRAMESADLCSAEKPDSFR